MPDPVRLLATLRRAIDLTRTMPGWTGRQIIKEDEDFNELFVAGVRQAYGSHGDEVYAAYLELFAVLPLALRTPNRIFLSHSVPSPKYLDGFDLASLTADEVAAE